MLCCFSRLLGLVAKSLSILQLQDTVVFRYQFVCIAHTYLLAKWIIFPQLAYSYLRITVEQYHNGGSHDQTHLPRVQTNPKRRFQGIVFPGTKDL